MRLLWSLFPILVLGTPFFRQIAQTKWAIGNNLWNATVGATYASTIYFGDRELVGAAKGHYAGFDGENNFKWTEAVIHRENDEFLDVSFRSEEVDMHWVIFPGLAGAYQYIVNRDLPKLGVLRTLFRFDNSSFTHGRTHVKDEPLPDLQDFITAEKVQDETWRRRDGSYLTKYDWSVFIRDLDFYGIYGQGVGSWYIRPGRDYFNGDHLKQELTVHRESRTGDSVQLNVIHGSHFQSDSKAIFHKGKMWGPWLWYLNNGSKADAGDQSRREFSKWPYKWIDDAAYQSRGSISGTLVLADGRPATGAAVFLGDPSSSVHTLNQGTNYYYTSYADDNGTFHINNVRSGRYALYAWANGGTIGDVFTISKTDGLTINASRVTETGISVWEKPLRKIIFQVGTFDHRAAEFKHGGVPYQHGLSDQSPASLVYTIGESTVTDWFFAQAAVGSWTIRFQLEDLGWKSAILAIGLAGYSKPARLDISLNGNKIGRISPSTIPSDPSVYRSSTVAGEWHCVSLNIDARLFARGWNELTLQITETKQWRGLLWDSIILGVE